MNDYITNTLLKLLIFNFIRTIIKIKYFDNNNIITLIYRPIKDCSKATLSIIIRIFFTLISKITLKFLYKN
jgi:hypothetical protein